METFSAVEIGLLENGEREVNISQQTNFTFTGDIGRYNTSLIIDPLPFPQSDYIICESTYGSRLHEENKDAELHILNTIFYLYRLLLYLNIYT